MADDVIESTEDAVVVDPTAEAAFAEAFSGAPTPTESAPPAVETPKAEESNVVEPVKEATPAPAPEPEFVQITKAQLAALEAKATSVDALQAEFKSLKDTSFGRIGGLERTIKEMTGKKEKPAPRTLTADDLPSVTGEYPDLAPRLAADLSKVLPQHEVVDQAELDQRVDAKVETAKEEITKAMEAQRTAAAVAQLDDLHPDWRVTVGNIQDPQTPFRQWLETQGATVRDRVIASQSPAYVGQMLTDFKNKKEAPAKSDATRKQRLLEAVPAKGGATVPVRAKEKTAEDAFREAFASV